MRQKHLAKKRRRRKFKCGVCKNSFRPSKHAAGMHRYTCSIDCRRYLDAVRRLRGGITVSAAPGDTIGGLPEIQVAACTSATITSDGTSTWTEDNE